MWLAAALVALLAAGAVTAALARRRLVVVTVAGTSMEPALRAGDRVLVRRRGGDPLRVGAIVVFREPPGEGRRSRPARVTRIAGQRWAIKRIAALPGAAVPESVGPAVGGADVVPPGMLVVLGDGVRSGDSRQWGFIPADQVLGQVTRKLARQGRTAGRAR